MFLPEFVKITEMSFQQRPLAISADYRPMFKISLMALVLYFNSRGMKASLLKLHLFSWALKSPKNMDGLHHMINKTDDKIHLWSIEPALNRALRFGVSEKIFSIRGHNYILEDKGILLAQKVQSDDEIFELEKEFLKLLGKSVTEGKILEISKNWLN